MCSGRKCLGIGLIVGGALAVAAVDRAAAQAAQPPQPPPYRGLFGSGSNPESAHSLTLTSSVYGGWDGNVLFDQAGGVNTPSTDQTSGTAFGGTLGLQYGKRGRRVDFAANADTAARYYPDQTDLTSGSYGFGAGLSAQLSRRTSLTLNQTVNYQPYYQLSLFPNTAPPTLGGGPSSNLDYVVSKNPGWIFGTSATLERQVGRRSNVQFFYGLNRSDFGNDSQPAPTPTMAQLLSPVQPSQTSSAVDVDSQYVGGRYSRGLARGVSLRLGYTYRRGNYASTAQDGTTAIAEGHDIDVGIDYSRALSISRRTQLSFSTGTSIVESSGQRRVDLIGSASLRHQIGRSWSAALLYSRGTGFVGNFAQPVFSDNAGISLGGLLGRRVSLSFNGGLSSGTVGFGGTGGDNSRFTTYTGSASLQYALNQFIGTFAEYSYFNYDFPASTLSPVVGQFDRNSVRGGISLSLPLLR